MADRVATYTPAIKQALNTAGADLYQKAVDAFNAKKYEDAAKLFDVTYLAQEQYAPKADTALYNNAAISMLQAHKYDEAAEYYKKLIDMGYTGIETVYEVPDVLSGKRQIYPSKKDLDTQVKLKLATDPAARVEPGQRNLKYTLLSSRSCSSRKNGTMLSNTPAEARAQTPAGQKTTL